MAVQVLAGTVVLHRGARIGVPGGDLHVAQVSASVEHGRDVRMAEHVRVCPGDVDAGGLGEEHGHRVLRVCGKGTKIVLVPLPPAVGAGACFEIA